MNRGIIGRSCVDHVGESGNEGLADASLIIHSLRSP